MSRSAKQDLPFVRLLSVVFLSANEFWKSENSREKVQTRCPWLHVCIVYLVDENCKSRLISNSQVMGDRWKLSRNKRIYIGSSAVYELFYSHGGLCRDKERLADQSVRGRFLFFAEKMRWSGNPLRIAVLLRGIHLIIWKLEIRDTRLTKIKLD